MTGASDGGGAYNLHPLSWGEGEGAQTEKIQTAFTSFKNYEKPICSSIGQRAINHSRTPFRLSNLPHSDVTRICQPLACPHPGPAANLTRGASLGNFNNPHVLFQRMDRNRESIS